MQLKRIVIETGWLLVAYLLFIIFLFNTNPQNLPVGVLMVPFIWLFVLQYVTIKLLLRILGPHVAGRLYRRRKSTALLLSIFSTLLLTLKSIDQLSVGDVLVVVALIFGFLFYTSRLNLRMSR